MIFSICGTVAAGDAAAVARLNATVSSGLLKLTWNGDANLSTTAPLLVNVTLPASAKTLSVAVANSPGVVWLAPNLTLSCLSVAASNGGGVYGNITSDMTGVVRPRPWQRGDGWHPTARPWPSGAPARVWSAPPTTQQCGCTA